MVQYTSRQSWQIPCHIPGPVMISSIFCFNHHLVGGFNPTPLKNDGLRHLGWWHSQLNVIITRGYFQKRIPPWIAWWIPYKNHHESAWNSHVPNRCPDFTMAPRSGTCSATARTRHPGAGANPPGPGPIQDGPKVNLTEIGVFFGKIWENGGLPSGKPT